MKCVCEADDTKSEEPERSDIAKCVQRVEVAFDLLLASTRGARSLCEPSPETSPKSSLSVPRSLTKGWPKNNSHKKIKQTVFVRILDCLSSAEN